MSVVTDSPVESSSSDDFAAFLDAELDSNSEEAVLQNKRVKRYNEVETVEIVKDGRGTASVASLEHNSEVSSSEEICTHPGSFGAMCIVCGQILDEESGVTFRYIHKRLRLGNDEIVRLRNADMKNLLCHKKLYLVLDLDHTLLNSTQLMHMTSDEEYLKSQTDSLQGIFCYLIIDSFFACCVAASLRNSNVYGLP